MVEMTEAANILNNATPNSLVIMDEIGRGTSTFDGLSLAWACAEHLARHNQCFTLFATHYFELTTLANELETVHNAHTSAMEHKNQVVFLHQVKNGAASQSYGIHVAQLAGVPKDVIASARVKLDGMKTRQLMTMQQTGENQLPLALDASATAPPRATEHPVMAALQRLQLDAINAETALQWLHHLKNLAQKKPENEKT